MASRDVQLRLTSTGLDALIAKFDEFSAKLDAIMAKVDDLSLKFDRLGAKNVTPNVDVKGVDSALAKVALLDTALDSVGKKSVTAKAASASTSIPKDVADAAVQEVFSQFPGLGNPQRGFSSTGFRSSVYGRTIVPSEGGGGGLFSSIRNSSLVQKASSGLSSLGQYFGIGSAAAGDAAQAAEGAAGAAGGGGAGGGGITGFFGQAAGPLALWGGLGGLALTIAPALIPALLGGGVGLAGGLGALALGSKAHTNMLTLQQNVLSAQQSLQTASKTSAPIYQQRLIVAQQKLAAYQKANAPALQSYTAFANLGKSAEGSFFGALTSNASRPVGETASGHQITQQIPGTSFLTGLSGILQQIGGFIKSIGPGLGQMFRASLPSLTMFVKVFENLVKQFLPAFTQMFNQIKPDLPIVMQGFNALTRGLTGFMHQLGPGMKASATDFKAIMIAIEGILIGLGWFASNLAIAFDKLGTLMNRVAHDIVNWWKDVYNFFSGLVTSIRNWFDKLPSYLQSIGRNMLSSLIEGMKQIPIIGTVITIGQGIVNAFKSVLHIGSPSKVMHDIGVNIGEGLGNGISASAGHVLGQATNLAGRIPGAFAAAGGAGAGRANAAPLPISLQLSLSNDLMQVISKQIRVSGGDPRILIRKVKVV